MLFVLKTGCQWNALNATRICPSSTAHERFQEWQETSVFPKTCEAGLEEYDETRAEDGVKRSHLTEGRGVPIGWVIDRANRNDMKLVKARIESMPIEWPKPYHPQNLCMDKGYDYPEVRQLVEEFRYIAHSKARGEDAQLIKRQAGSRRVAGVWSGRTAG